MAEKLQLPLMQHTFNISVKGSETSKIFEGSFTYVRPNLHKRAEISKMRTRLSGDLKNLPYDVQLFNEMCATLFYCLQEKPQWWSDSNEGRDLYDINVVEEIYKECQDFEQEWLSKVLGDRKTDVMDKKPEEN